MNTYDHDAIHVGHSGAEAFELPTLNPRPSIHPSGLLQWHDSRYDEGLVEAIEETRASWWSNPVTAEFRDELVRHDPRWRSGV